MERLSEDQSDEHLLKEEREEMQLQPGGSDDQPEAVGREGIQLQLVSGDGEELPPPQDRRPHRVVQQRSAKLLARRQPLLSS